MRELVAAAIAAGLLLPGPALAQQSERQRLQGLIEAQERERAPAQAAALEYMRSGKLPKDYKARIDRAFIPILKDPDSRKIDELRTPRGTMVCGQVNAKNSYGGYVGRQPFVAYLDRDGKVPLLEMFELSRLSAVRANKGPGQDYHLHYEILKECGFLPGGS